MKTHKSKCPDVYIPDSLSCPQFALGKFEQYGERTAVVDASSGSSYTFKQLKDLSWKFGSALAKRGLKKGDILAVILPNVIQYPIIYYGALSLGLTLTTVNPQYKSDEIVYQLRDASVRYIITDLERLPCVQRAAMQVGICTIFTLEKVKGFESFYELVEDASDCFLTDAKTNPKDDVAVLLYSSGTTGLPKGCMLTHYNLVALYCTLGVDSVASFSSRSVVLSLLPLFHGYGQTVIMGTGLCKGAKLVIIQQFVPELFLQTLEHYKVTNAPVVPPVVLFLAKHPMVDNYDTSSLCDVVSGGAPVGDELFILLRKRLPHIQLVRRGYGMTECVSATHISSVYGSKPHSCGGLIPNMECKIVHPESNATLGANEVGEICIRGPTVMKGYLNKPEATAQTIDREGWVHTGDIGHCDEEGYLYVVDRKKELIKYKGFQVPPAELEALLISHPVIDDAAVVGVPDVEAGELPKAFVVRRGHLTSREIVDFVAMKVAPHKKLRGGVEFVDQIPKSPSGKILRRVLIEQQKKSKL